MVLFYKESNSFNLQLNWNRQENLIGRTVFEKFFHLWVKSDSDSYCYDSRSIFD